MRATGQAHALTGPLAETDRRLVAARAILGEWLGGSGGGWQDSGGLWPAMKLIEGVAAAEGDSEFGISRGCLLPRHRILGADEVSAETRRNLQASLVLVHGGMAQDVGPILEMVTEKYLLRSEAEWQGRQQAIRTLDEILGTCAPATWRPSARATERNFEGPIQTIIPWASNLYTETLIRRAREEMGAGFWGFWMLGGMSGGGMGFIFDPAVKPRAEERLAAIMRETKHRLERAVPFAMEPVVYDFAINERGTQAELLQRPRRAHAARLLHAGRARPAAHRNAPASRRPPRRTGSFRRRLPHRARTVRHGAEPVRSHAAARRRTMPGPAQSLAALLDGYGFDRVQHEQIQADLRSGRIGLAQNRLPVHQPHRRRRARRHRGCDRRPARALSRIRHAGAGRWYGRRGHSGRRRGQPLDQGRRRRKSAASVLRSSPARHRNFIEAHLAKSRRTSRIAGTPLPHVITTSYLTHDAVADWLAAAGNYGYPGPLLLSPGRNIGLRLVPMVRDLRFAWEEMPQQLLDDQAQKVRESLHASLIAWAQQAGEGEQLYRQPAAAMPASGRALVRAAEPVPQRRAGAPARGASAPALSHAAQHRYAGRRSSPRSCWACTSNPARR